MPPKQWPSGRRRKSIRYSVPSGVMRVTSAMKASASRLKNWWLGITGRGVTEVILMNEQGARFFDRYTDSLGLLLYGKNIGCWDEVDAREASFGGSTTGASFTAEKAEGARLFRGRELVGSRLAWSGFGYSFPPSGQTVSYTLRIVRDP